MSARIHIENVISTNITVKVMEMVELYCELLLARVNVMDQVVFGEKGVRVRSRAKEEKIKGEMEKKKQSGGAAASTAGGKDASTTGDGGSSRSLFGFQFGKAFGGGGGQQPKKTPKPSTRDTKDQD